MRFRIGTRKSPLALIQTSRVADRIKLHYPEIHIEIVGITTWGDVIKDVPLYDIGGKALFLKEIEQSLIEGSIDMAVHSLKDVPGEIDPRLKLSAMLEREYPFDLFVSKKFKHIDELTEDSILGTSSVRRIAFAKKINPGIRPLALRGNVDSRMKKVLGGELEATILAEAGVRRLGLYDPSYCFPLPASEILPAVGQGIITTEIKTDHALAAEISSQINHEPTWNAALAERSFLENMKADCRTPLGAYASYIEKDRIEANFALALKDGTILSERLEFSVEQATETGAGVARRFLGLSLDKGR